MHFYILYNVYVNQTLIYGGRSVKKTLHKTDSIVENAAHNMIL